MTNKAFDSTVISRGRTTVPVAVRQRLGLVAGGNVIFMIGDDDRIEMRAAVYPTVASLRGAAGSLEKACPWHEMRAIAREDQASRLSLLDHPNDAAPSVNDVPEDSGT